MTNKTSHIAFLTILTLCLAALGVFGVSYAAEEGDTAFRSTAFPLPRFVSLSSDEVFARSGPGSRYPVKWVYHKKGLPVEVILEYEVWRKIKDVDGETGWVHQSLISGKRTAQIKDGGQVSLLQKPKDSATKTAILDPRVVVGIDECDDTWCKVSITGYQGWLKRSQIWGVYDKEKID
jgi:SH3-like domain-containing protein